MTEHVYRGIFSVAEIQHFDKEVEQGKMTREQLFQKNWWQTVKQLLKNILLDCYVKSKVLENLNQEFTWNVQKTMYKYKSKTNWKGDSLKLVSSLEFIQNFRAK